MTISANIKARATGLLGSFQAETMRVPTDANPLTTGLSGNLKEASPGDAQELCDDSNAQSPSASTATVRDFTAPHEPFREYEIRSLIGWLNQRVTEQGLSLVTARCYRRWLASYFESVDDPCAVTIRNWIPPGSVEAAIKSDEVDARILATPGVVTSARKMAELATTNSSYLTYLDSDTLSLLLDQLISTDGDVQRYELGPVTALFFTTSMMTGLRPMEWETARYRETHFDPESKLTLGPVLDVLSLKQKNRRDDNPLRERRYLLLDEWPEDQLNGLQTFLKVIVDTPVEFRKLYESMRKALTRAWAQVLKNNEQLRLTSATFLPAQDGEPGAAPPPQKLVSLAISPNSARHIFAEECRRSMKFTRYELASMLGHSMITNQVHYGPRQEHLERGHTFVLPRPWPGDAEAIMAWDDMVNPRRNYYRQGVLDIGASSDDNAETTGMWDDAGKSTSADGLKRL